MNGTAWGNDYPFVSAHDSWFWRNTSGGRVVSTADGKWLMNISDPGWQSYWLESMSAQVKAGQYSGIFFDSASPPLIQGETVADPRLKATGVRDNPIPELGGLTYVQAWERWIGALDTSLRERGVPLIPNYDNFATSWDTTNYSLTAGCFSEGFASARLDLADWERRLIRRFGPSPVANPAVQRRLTSSFWAESIQSGEPTWFASGPMQKMYGRRS